ncbi:class I SAM-dependent methyltransferase [Patescibacteria group bacterium]|nr:class I SAM-dependent methyltransferase [Patescibacteria group bacterium]
MSIIKDQKYFFDINSKKVCFTINENNFFYTYVVKDVKNAFLWLKDKKNILDYGCGTGASIDLYLDSTKNNSVTITGVDISGESIKIAKQKHPNYFFYKIENNRMPQFKNENFDSAYLIHVLHHSHDHQEMFNEIYNKLSKNGKFFICDLSSNNHIIKFFRYIFQWMPSFIKNKFNDDLVINGDIPEKNKVDIDTIKKKLVNSGFTIIEVGYSHLFFFVFAWIDKISGISNVKVFRNILNVFLRTEIYLLKYKIFQGKCESFYIKCIKG